MKKTYKLQNLECAHCAAKMETAINKMADVDACTISFMTQKMTIETTEDKLDAVLDEAQKAIKKIERNCKIVR